MFVVSLYRLEYSHNSADCNQIATAAVSSNSDIFFLVKADIEEENKAVSLVCLGGGGLGAVLKVATYPEFGLLCMSLQYLKDSSDILVARGSKLSYMIRQYIYIYIILLVV